MDKSLERLSWAASIGSFVVAALSLPWFSQILGLPIPAIEVGGVKFQTPDISTMPFAFRISATFFLLFAYSWLFTLIAVSLGASGAPAGYALGAIVVFFAAVLVLSTLFAVGFNSVQVVEGSRTAMNNLRLAFFFWSLVAFGLFMTCALGHVIQLEESRREALLLFIFMSSGFSFVVGGLSLF